MTIAAYNGGEPICLMFNVLVDAAGSELLSQDHHKLPV